MLPRDGGVIGAAKHAVEGFTESLRTELIHDGSNLQVTTVHLRPVNTPQFDWEKGRLEYKAQSLPSTFQPEVAARAIVHAIDHPRREYLLGRSTLMAVWGNRFLPGFLDWYLARTGYEAQQTDEPEDPDRSHDLWEPLAGDHGTHGRFDDRSETWSPQFWVTTHRPAVGAGLVTLTGLAALATIAARVRNGR